MMRSSNYFVKCNSKCLFHRIIITLAEVVEMAWAEVLAEEIGAEEEVVEEEIMVIHVIELVGTLITTVGPMGLVLMIRHIATIQIQVTRWRQHLMTKKEETHIIVIDRLGVTQNGLK